MMKKTYTIPALGLLLSVMALQAGLRQEVVIENGEIRLGADLASGGGIFYFSRVAPTRNVLNHADKGRFIQQSYYGDLDGTKWDGKPWRWNPVQGGNYQNIPATVLAKKVEPSSLYVKTRPRHWASGDDLRDVVMEEWLSLEGAVARLRFRFQYTGKRSFAPHHQELPAVFVDYGLNNLVFYAGPHPWTGGELEKMNPGFPNEYGKTTESWAAWVDDTGWGLGIYFPGSTEFTCYRYEGDGKAGPEGMACSYVSPIQTWAVTPGLVYEYEVFITIGTIDEIRKTFHDLHQTGAGGEVVPVSGAK